MLRIGNAHGFWGDRLSAAAEMLTAEPDLDYLTLDFLAEVSMSILALQRERDPAAGFPRDFVEIVKSIAPYWKAGGRCRVITNAGGLNPLGCAQACSQVLRNAGCANRRLGKPHIIARIKEGMVVFDPRTLNDEELGKIVEAVEKILQKTEDREQKPEKSRQTNHEEA